MPEKIVLEDGTEREVLTEEEQKELQEKAQKVDDLNSQLETITKEKNDLEEGVNPNWPDVRKKLKRQENLEKAMKEKGLVFDENGNITDDPSKEKVTQDDVTKKATEAANNVIINNHIEAKLLSFDDATREVILEKYKKLSSGEELTSLSKVDSILNDSIKLVVPEHKPVEYYQRGNPAGRPPNFKSDNEITNTTREIGKQLGITDEDYKKSEDVSDLLLSK